MSQKKRNPSHDESVVHKDVENQMRALFEQMPQPIPVYLFTRKGENDPLNQAGRELHKAFSSLSDKIQFVGAGPAGDPTSLRINRSLGQFMSAFFGFQKAG